MSVLSIRILCSIASVLATDLQCLQTQIPLAHSDQSTSLQLNSLTYSHPQEPIVHELSLGKTLVTLALGSTCSGGSGGFALAIVRVVLASSYFLFKACSLILPIC